MDFPTPSWIFLLRDDFCTPSTPRWIFVLAAKRTNFHPLPVARQSSRANDVTIGFSYFQVNVMLMLLQQMLFSLLVY